MIGPSIVPARGFLTRFHRPLYSRHHGHPWLFPSQSNTRRTCVISHLRNYREYSGIFSFFLPANLNNAPEDKMIIVYFFVPEMELTPILKIRSWSIRVYASFERRNFPVNVGSINDEDLCNFNVIETAIITR